MMNERNIPTPATVLQEDYAPQRSIVTLSDGYPTSVYIHRPAVPAGLPVVYVHGIQSHPGWYYASGKALADAGHCVYQPTRRGSGDNSISPGHCKSPEQLFDDIDTVIDIACRENNCDKVILLGVSWGGKLIAGYCLSSKQRAVRVAKLVLIAPGLFSKIDVPFRTKLGVALTLLLMPQKQFDIPLGDVELFTDNPALQEYLRSDDYQLHHVTSRFMFTSKLLDKAVARAAGKSIVCDATLLLSAADKIINNQATSDWFSRVCKAACDISMLPGEHTLEFTPDSEIFEKYTSLLTRACQVIK